MDPVISLQGVSKHLSGRQVLRDVGFAVEPGDIFGCLGPNGAGKTTTIRIILGLLKVSAGTVRVLGGHPDAERVRSRVGFLLEADGLYENISAWDNLAYYGRLYDVKDIPGRIEAVLQTAGLADRAGDKVSTYSKGMRQRLALARSVLHHPELLILDEPTAGLDPGGQMEVRQTLLELSRTEGKTIFLSSHNLDEMQRLCNRITLIHGGEIRLYGDLKELARGSGRKGVAIETAAPIPADVLEDLVASAGVVVRSQKGNLVSLAGGADLDVPELVAFLAGRGVGIEQVIKEQDSLEDLYLRIEAEAEGSGSGSAEGGRDG